MEKRNADLISITILRGLAATAVFFYHYHVGALLSGIFQLSFLEFIDRIGALYAVPLFFLISGFCIHLSQLRFMSGNDRGVFSVRDYYTRRFWRIYPAYFVALLFSCVALLMSGRSITIPDFLTHLFLLQGFSVAYFNSINLVLWTISIEVLFYLLYPVWYFMRQRLGLHVALLISFLVSLSSCAAIYLSGVEQSFPVTYFVFNLWGAWCFGSWLCEMYMYKNIELLRRWDWWVAFITTIILYCLCSNSDLSIITYNLTIILWAWIVLICLKLEKFFVKISQSKFRVFIVPFTYIGLSSYSLYMLHQPMLSIRNIILQNVNQPIVRVLIGISWIVVVFFVSWFSYQLFEKPFLRSRSKLMPE